MRVTVTGSTGHVGANLVRVLLDHGHEVRAVYRNPAHLSALDGLGVERVQADVCDRRSVEAALHRSDAVMHLAAVISINGDPDGSVARTNVAGAGNVARCCLALGVAKLVHVSSIHAFKITGADDPVDERHPAADACGFAYDRSKAGGEREVLAAVADGLDATILNPTAVIGPYDFRPSRAGSMLGQMFDGRLRLLVQGGFDWVDARDVSLAALAALAGGRRGERYILSGTWLSFADLARLCDATAARRVTRWSVPIGAARGVLPLARMADRLLRRRALVTAESLHIVEHGSRRCSSAKARRELGFTPRPIEETLADTWAWFRSRA